MKKIICASLALYVAFAAPAFAACIGNTCFVNLQAVYADPSDVVLQTDTNGPCGSRFFHIQRGRVNFRELSAVALTAFSTTQKMDLFVRGCQNDRNLLSHGNVRN
jgi:hypothetical protein